MVAEVEIVIVNKVIGSPPKIEGDGAGRGLLDSCIGLRVGRMLWTSLDLFEFRLSTLATSSSLAMYSLLRHGRPFVVVRAKQMRTEL